MFLFLLYLVRNLSDSDPLVTQELVDKINNNPKSTFKAKLYPKFAKLTVGDAKKFLSPVRPSPVKKGSAYPIGADETKYKDNYVAIKFENQPDQAQYTAPVYDVSNLCSSWAPAATSAVSLSVSRWANRFINFSLQYVLDCDLLGDACMERPSLSSYALFWHNKIPEAVRWDQPGTANSGRTSPLHAPVAELTSEICAKDDSDPGCYPGTSGCSRSYALTGSCNPGDTEATCPIYYLYNWRWIKSHLFEVGPVTSSILVYNSLFTYTGGDDGNDVYGVLESDSEPLGMLDVTIIGWGQYSSKVEVDPTESKNRWWWVIPHLGDDFGVQMNVDEPKDDSTDPAAKTITVTSGSTETEGNHNRGFMKFNRRFDDCLIESQAVGAVPYNFIPSEKQT